jgi:hypothetical protein
MLASTMHFSKNNHTPPTPTHPHPPPQQQPESPEHRCGMRSAGSSATETTNPHHPRQQQPHNNAAATRGDGTGPFPQDPTVHPQHHPHPLQGRDSTSPPPTNKEAGMFVSVRVPQLRRTPQPPTKGRTAGPSTSRPHRPTPNRHHPTRRSGMQTPTQRGHPLPEQPSQKCSLERR